MRPSDLEGMVKDMSAEDKLSSARQQREFLDALDTIAETETHVSARDMHAVAENNLEDKFAALLQSMGPASSPE